MSLPPSLGRSESCIAESALFDAGSKAEGELIPSPNTLVLYHHCHHYWGGVESDVP
jgi:hypothetical protein